MTLIDLYRKALEKLQVVAAGEEAEPEDTVLVEEKYAAVYDMLLSLGLVSWTATEDVPAFAVLPLTAMLAFAAAQEFGIDPNQFAAEGAIGMAVPSLAERQLRQQLARSYVSHPVSTTYY